MQEVEATSSDVTEKAADFTEMYKTAKESVSVGQGQLTASSRTRLRCIKSENAATESNSRDHTLAAEFWVYIMCVWTSL